MYLVYVDESGKPSVSDPEDFVLAGCMVNERDWQTFDNNIRSLKRRWFPGLAPDQVELHANQIVHSKGPFAVLGMRKFDLLREVYGLIGRTACDLVAINIRKAKTKKGFDIEMWAWRLLFERVCLALSMHNAALLNQ